jgi:hypothetical protein
MISTVVTDFWPGIKKRFESRDTLPHEPTINHKDDFAHFAPLKAKNPLVDSGAFKISEMSQGVLFTLIHNIAIYDKNVNTL